MPENFFLTIATCSKDDFSELLETCMSVRLFTSAFPDVKFEHVLVLSDYRESEIHSVERILTLYRKNVRSEIICMQAKGISSAFNKALEVAKGKYITFLNAGDTLTPDSDCLNAVNRIMNNFDNLDSLNQYRSPPVYYFDLITTGNTRLACRRVRAPCNLTVYHFIKMGNPINHQSTLYPLALAQKYSYPSLSIGMDYCVNFSMKLNGVEFCKLPGVLVTYNITGISAKYPFQRLMENASMFISESLKRRLFGLIALFLLLLPFVTIKAAIQKLTYLLR